MLDPPADLANGTVLDAVSADWPQAAGCDDITYLPVGFGAHHWRADRAGVPQLFVTVDRFGSRHTPASLEDAYASAASLDLSFVAAPTPSSTGAFTRPLGGGALSCTTWLDGAAAGLGPITDPELAATNIALLDELHAAIPPQRIPRWQPLVGPDLPQQLAALLGSPWDTGPLGEQARRATVAQLDQIDAWVQRYHDLANTAQGRRWVATHGEPHTRNQMLTPSGLRLVDWESLKLAPRERDLGALLDAGHTDRLDPDWAMVEMFDLEWRLDEIDQYTRWLSQPHAGTASDRTALGGLLDELSRPPWIKPA